ncbi:MAG: DnaB helicase C-terminal domain-containing protein [Eubacteriaceae bacterium]|nr:DnaB helicase C-terminal domain-containing protein [Eubacteriaceae bacterium]
MGEAVGAYSKFAGRVHINEGIGDIGAQQIEQHVKGHTGAYGGKPVAIVDYLQIIMPPGGRSMSDKQATDRNVFALKRLSRELGIALIAVSSFNRMGYNAKASMEAFKESGAVEYSSDVLLGLQLREVGKSDCDADLEKRKNPKEVEVVVMKSRNRPTGRLVAFDYYPTYSYFAESAQTQGRSPNKR